MSYYKLAVLAACRNFGWTMQQRHSFEAQQEAGQNSGWMMMQQPRPVQVHQEVGGRSAAMAQPPQPHFPEARQEADDYLGLQSRLMAQKQNRIVAAHREAYQNLHALRC
ncbi:MAG: hypothetical protein JKY99_00665 [Rhizobiales bacterium]|nr:hypothetical protein [Hyphomicrobiales bacterium]